MIKKILNQFCAVSTRALASNVEQLHHMDPAGSSYVELVTLTDHNPPGAN